MSETHRITVDPNQCGGRPCLRGRRIRVKDVLDLLAAGAADSSSKKALLFWSCRRRAIRTTKAEGVLFARQKPKACYSHDKRSKKLFIAGCVPLDAVRQIANMARCPRNRIFLLLLSCE